VSIEALKGWVIRWRSCGMSLHVKGKGKAVPLKAWSGSEGSRKLRFPDFLTTAQDSQPYAPAAFNPRKCSWYSFLLKAESTPGPLCDRRDFISIKNSNDTSWDRTSDLPICSTARHVMYFCKIAQSFGGSWSSESYRWGQLTCPEILQHIPITAECAAPKVHAEILDVIHPIRETFVQNQILFLNLFFLRIKGDLV